MSRKAISTITCYKTLDMGKIQTGSDVNQYPDIRTGKTQVTFMFLSRIYDKKQYVDIQCKSMSQLVGQKRHCGFMKT